VILMLECLIFGMFVLAIMIDQLSAIFSDETAVEHVSCSLCQHLFSNVAHGF